MKIPPKIIVDSNIIIYALNSKSPKHKEAREFLSSKKFSLYFTHQNIFESLRVLTHPSFGGILSTSQAVKKISKIISFGRVVCPQIKTYSIALEVVRKYSLGSNLVFDAYLAATALDNGINYIATDNEKDFYKINEIKIYNPFTK